MHLRPEASMTPQDQSQKTRVLCQIAPVIPVIVIEDAARAEGLARCLLYTSPSPRD